jgi:hypothetical protein
MRCFTFKVYSPLWRSQKYENISSSPPLSPKDYPILTWDIEDQCRFSVHREGVTTAGQRYALVAGAKLILTLVKLINEEVVQAQYHGIRVPTDITTGLF